MGNFIRKIFSRKLAVALGAVVTALTQSDLTLPQLVVVGAVACAYVVAQALVDRGVVDAELVDLIADQVSMELAAQLEQEREVRRRDTGAH